jgi:fluoroacetyl-CoA thioesterase
MTTPFPVEGISAVPGLTGETTRVVGSKDTAIAVGSGDLPVLATPILVALMEAAACSALAGHLPERLTSVGSHLDVRHLAPSPIGARVTARASVTEVRGAKVTFEVTAQHDVGGRRVDIGRGTHARVIVDRESFGRD